MSFFLPQIASPPIPRNIPKIGPRVILHSFIEITTPAIKPAIFPTIFPIFSNLVSKVCTSGFTRPKAEPIETNLSYTHMIPLPIALSVYLTIVIVLSRPSLNPRKKALILSLQPKIVSAIGNNPKCSHSAIKRLNSASPPTSSAIITLSFHRPRIIIPRPLARANFSINHAFRGSVLRISFKSSMKMSNVKPLPCSNILLA